MAASFVEERIAASRGELQTTPVRFFLQRAVEYGGVLALIPCLIQQGLLSYKHHYTGLKKGYYNLQCIVLCLALMYLCRIKNPEQLKQHKSGELGKLMGLDRVPETRCLRSKVKQIVRQEKATPWNQTLSEQWIGEQDEPYIYYIDGHVNVYNGYKARLGKKHIARQKLCLPGISEFWVHNRQGLPYMVVTGEVNEKLIEALTEKIIPEIKQLSSTAERRRRMEADDEEPLCVIVFDREAWSPAFFKQLWQTHRIAVLTYRKNVTDKWAETEFSEHSVGVDQRKVTMPLCEKEFVHSDFAMREIRKLTDTGHQTSIITTYRKMEMPQLAYHMFSRWSQENFFWYMRRDYALDMIPEYTVYQLDGRHKVVNPMYSKLTNRLKTIREKIQRRRARLHQLEEQISDSEDLPDKKTVQSQAKLKEELADLQDDENQLVEERKNHSYYIHIEDMPEQYKYNKLNDEAKHFQNIIKMICYRAETALGELLSSDYKKKQDEMRMFVKQIVQTKADIIPDYENKTLTVRLYSLARPRDNEEVEKIFNVLNQSETQYPGTDLVLKYEMASF